MNVSQIDVGAAPNGINTPHASAAGEGPRPPPTASDIANLPNLSRTRVLPTETEEADTVLSLGEFQNVDTLSHSEAKVLMETLMMKKINDAGGARVNTTETLSKTQDYLAMFARFKTRQMVIAVSDLLEDKKVKDRLESFERSQLITLCPTEADEAFTLIPSLKPKFTEAEMEVITRQISDLKTFE